MRLIVLVLLLTGCSASNLSKQDVEKLNANFTNLDRRVSQAEVAIVKLMPTPTATPKKK